MAFTPLNAPSSPSTSGPTPGFVPLGQTAPTQPPTTPPQPPQTIPGTGGVPLDPNMTFGQKISAIPAQLAGVGKAAFNLLTGSEQAVGGEIAAGANPSVTGEAQLNAANQGSAQSDIQFIQAMNALKQSGKTLTPQQQAIYNNILQTHSGTGITQTDLLPHAADTNTQALGNVAGVGLDMLSAGSYGADARAASSFSRYVAPAVTKTGSMTLGQIAKQTVVRSAVGGGVGYGYDVTNNLQQGKTGPAALTPGAATIAGLTFPAVVGGVRLGVTFSKDQAPRFINSLIKPKLADFSYGKDPGRTVSELGITGNSLSDFSNNIAQAKQNIGAQLGAIYSSPANADVRINAAPALSNIDDAIATAASGGKNNQGLVNQLINIKDALLYEHGIDANGNIVRTGDTPRDLTNLTPQEAQDFIQHVADQTQFTGRPSDDKLVNLTLKAIYGDVRSKINAGVSVNNPEIQKLNQQYADLTSALIATQNRDKIVQRSNMVSLPSGGAAGVGAIITAIATGGAAIPAILGGASAYAVEKAFESTPVKTRIAAWLGKQSPNALQAFFKANPKLAPIFTRAFPALVGKLGNNSNNSTNQ